MRAPALIAATLLTLANPAAADVVSAKADRVAVTIYRDGDVSTTDLMSQDSDDDSGLAMITETRTVDLPAGRVKIRFEGVADGIMPQSAAVEGLPGRLVERNFDYDLLTPGSLIERSVGKTVTWIRTDRATGRETREPAVLRTGPDGVLLDFGGGRIEALRCAGGHERLVLEQIPEGLTDRPTLSALADIPVAGRYAVRLSYLTVRMNWSADYIARIAPDGKTLDLTGWITLANRSGIGFIDAPTQVVAGRLAREEVELPDIEVKPLRLECWPLGNTHNRWMNRVAIDRLAVAGAPREENMQSVPVSVAAFGELVVTAQKRTALSELGDYKLYSLIEPTTVAARQTKQVLFLHQSVVKFDTVYVYRLAQATFNADDQDRDSAAKTTLRFINKTDQGLGEPLPSGNVAVRQPQDIAGGREVFLGEHGIRDVPVGEPAELEVGEASDIHVKWRVVAVTSFKRKGRECDRVRIEAVITNAKPVSAPVEYRQAAYGEGFRIAAEDRRHGIKGGDPIWRLSVPANAEIRIAYTVEYLTD